VKKVRSYKVTLRRDVQQVAYVSVDAYNAAEAVAVAQAVVDGSSSTAWETEQGLGTHPPKTEVEKPVPIKGRSLSKSDRRTNTDRRASKRRVGDKSRELATARNKRG
jgi:hypothetical protein